MSKRQRNLSGSPYHIETIRYIAGIEHEVFPVKRALPNCKHRTLQGICTLFNGKYCGKACMHFKWHYLQSKNDHSNGSPPEKCIHYRPNGKCTHPKLEKLKMKCNRSITAYCNMFITDEQTKKKHEAYKEQQKQAIAIKEDQKRRKAYRKAMKKRPVNKRELLT